MYDACASHPIVSSFGSTAVQAYHFSFFGSICNIVTESGIPRLYICKAHYHNIMSRNKSNHPMTGDPSGHKNGSNRVRPYLPTRKAAIGTRRELAVCVFFSLQLSIVFAGEVYLPKDYYPAEYRRSRLITLRTLGTQRERGNSAHAQ